MNNSTPSNVDEKETQLGLPSGSDFLIQTQNGYSDNLCKVYLCRSNLKLENVERFLIPCQTCTNTENITDCLTLQENSNQNLDDYLCSKSSNQNIASNAVSEREELLKLLIHTAKGLNYLHENNIAHCNIQPTNIKIFNHKHPDKITAKLGGLRYYVDLRHNVRNNAINNDHDDRSPKALEWHPKSFMAPECLEPYGDERVRNKQTDIFALGILFYYTLTSQCHPFAPIPDQKNFEEATEKIRCGKIYPTNENKPKFLKLRELKILSKEQKVTIADMIWHMIDWDPSKRFEVKDVLNHPSFYNAEKKLNFLLTVHENTKDSADDLCKNYQKLKKIEADINEKKNSLNSSDDQLQRKKIKDLIKRRDNCIKEKSKILENNCEVNEYERRLEDDDANDFEKKTFDIHEDTGFANYEYLKEKNQDNPLSLWKPVLARDVTTLLKCLRNKVYHACDSDNPKEFQKQFLKRKDTYNAEMFLEVFVSPWPPLLVHLYELCRRKDWATDFFLKPSTNA